MQLLDNEGLQVKNGSIVILATLTAFMLSGCATMDGGVLGRCWGEFGDTRSTGNGKEVRVTWETIQRGMNCVKIETEVAQRKSAEQAEQELRRKTKGGGLPEGATVKYSITMDPAHGRVAKGATLVLRGHVEVVTGSVEKVDRVEEELVVSLDNEEVQTIKEPMEGKGGVFDTTHTFNFPKKFQEGFYTISARVRLNGKVVPGSVRYLKLHIAQLPQEGQMLAMGGF